MRYEKEWFLSSGYSCWQAALYSDTSQLPSLLALRPQGLNRGILQIPGSNLSKNRTSVTQCLHGRPRLGTSEHCHLQLYISIPHSTRLERASRERKRLWSRR